MSNQLSHGLINLRPPNNNSDLKWTIFVILVLIFVYFSN